MILKGLTQPLLLLLSLLFSHSVLSATDASDLIVFEILYNSTDGPNWTTQPTLSDPCSDVNLVGCDGSSNIVALYLSANGLSGTIPSELSQLSALVTLQLSENSLSSTIPSQLGLLTTLKTLNLRSNPLTGPIPTQLGQLSLTTLLLSATQLSGPVPTELKIPGLINLGLSNTGLCPLNNYSSFATYTDFPFDGKCQCQPSSCPALRACSASQTSYTCACLPGYYGPNCTACNCGHGTCFDGLTGNGTCICNKGWSIHADSCSICAKGYFGPTCANKCISCGHGNCTDGLTGDGSCSCSKGWAVNETGACGSCAEGFSGDKCAATLPVLPTYAIGLIYAAVLLIVLLGIAYVTYKDLSAHNKKHAGDAEKGDATEMKGKDKEKEGSIEEKESKKEVKNEGDEKGELEPSEIEKDKSALQVTL